MDDPDLLELLDSRDAERLAAALAREPELVARRVAHGGNDWNARHWTPLHRCAWNRDRAGCELLLEAGADPEARDADGRSALHNAVEAGSDDVAGFLLERGATLDICSAALLGREDRVAELLAEDPGLAREASTGMTPMGWAAYGNQAGVARLLHAAGCGFGGEDLANAASVDAARFVACALELGADPDLRDGQGATALHHAACMNFTRSSTRVATVLLDGGADPNARLGEGGPTPLELLYRVRQREAGEAPTRHPCEAEPAQKDFEGLERLLLACGGRPPQGG